MLIISLIVSDSNVEAHCKEDSGSHVFNLDIWTQKSYSCLLQDIIKIKAA